VPLGPKLARVLGGVPLGNVLAATDEVGHLGLLPTPVVHRHRCLEKAGKEADDVQRQRHRKVFVICTVPRQEA